MKIALIDPRTNKVPAESFPHLGLGYLAAVARQGGHDVRLIDSRMLRETERRDIFKSDFDVFGITATSFTYTDALKVAQEARDHNPDSIIILGGPHVTTAYDDDFLLNSPFDFAVCGEGEKTFRDLLYVYDNESEMSVENIPGILYVRDGRVVRNTSRPWIEHLDEINEPDFSSLDMKKYSHYPVITSRGCPFQCIYCNCGLIWGKKWRFRSPEKIVQEMLKVQLLTEDWGEKSFNILDDTFNLRPERVEKICDLLLAENFNSHYYVWGFRADRAPVGMLEKMKQTGCLSVSMGVESANPEVLKLIRKGETIDQILETIQNLKKAGIYPTCLFMIGNPGDTLATVEETIRFVKKNRLFLVAFNMALPYPKTDLWSYVSNEGTFLHNDYTKFHHYSGVPIFETKDFSAADRSEAFRMVQQLERVQRIKFEIYRKISLIRRGDFKAITWKRSSASVVRMIKYFLDLLFKREPKEKF